MNQFPMTDQCCRELVKRQKALVASLVAQSQSTMVVEPRQGALHHPAGLSKPRTVRIVPWPGQQRHNPTLQCGSNVALPTVAAITLKYVRTKTRPTYALADRGNRIQQGDGYLAVADVGGRGNQCQRNALGIGNQMAFAAVLRSIRGVRPGVDPPKTARTLALSMIAFEKSTRPLRPSALRMFCQIAGQTPASVQARNRRQQVLPSPQPNSAGKSFQMQPVRKTKIMPTKQRRSGMRGRPPLGFGGSGGSKGWICSHSSSLNHCRAIGLSSMIVPMVQISSSSAVQL